MVNNFFRSLILILFLLAPLQLVGASVPLFSNPVSVFSLAELGENDILVKTIFDQIQVHFPLAAGKKIDRAVLRLHLSHGKKLLPELSTLMIALNDEPAANILLTPKNNASHSEDIELPVEALKAGDNIIAFRFYLRLRDQGCADASDPGLWAKIYADSLIELEGSDIPLVPDLGRYPVPFVSLSSLEGSPQLSFVLPKNPTPAELTAAAQISAYLGQAALWEQPPLLAFTFEKLDEAQLSTNHLIVIDTSGRNPLAGTSLTGLTEVISPYNPNRLMLTVSGVDDSSLIQATALLSTQSAHSKLHGSHIDPFPFQPRLNIIQPSLVSFAEVGFETQRVRGIGVHDLYYPIDVPYDWKTTSEASIELHFTHAPSLVSTSLMGAFINGFNVTNVQLNKRNDTNGRLVIILSPRQIHPGRNWLHLSFNLHVRSEDCKYRYLEEAWVEISAADSMINLAHVNSSPPLELYFFPSSLVTPSDLSADLFVLPTEPTPTDLTAMVRLSAKLGTYSKADGLRPQVTTADLFVNSLNSGSNVIAIGTPESNALIGTYDTHLPQPLQKVNGLISPASGRELLPEEESGEAGYIQILSTPWSGSDVLVVFSADKEERLLHTIDILPIKGHRLYVHGNMAVVTVSKISGQNLGGYAAARLPASARITLVVIFISAGVIMGGIGIVITLRKRKINQEKINADK